jgi:hypothetical protein
MDRVAALGTMEPVLATVLALVLLHKPADKRNKGPFRITNLPSTASAFPSGAIVRKRFLMALAAIRSERVGWGFRRRRSSAQFRR